MIITIHVDPSWLAHPESLGRILAQVRALEDAAPYAPPLQRQPGEDDLAELTAGMDGPEPAPAPAAAAKPKPSRGRPFEGTPATGQQLYRWACDRKCLPEINALGKLRGFPKLVTHWEPDQVATVFGELTARPAVANGPVAR
jgi:hypothetical protein